MGFLELEDVNAVKNAVKTFSEKLTEYVTKAEVVKILSFPDTISFHASLLIASLIAEKKDRVKISFSMEISNENEEGIFVGFDLKEKTKKSGIYITKNFVVFPNSKVETIALNPVLQALQLMENITLIQDSKLMLAYSSLFQELQTLGEDDPLIRFIQSITPIKLHKKGLALVQTSNRSIVDSIYHTVDPFFISLSASKYEKIFSTLKEIGIDPSQPFSKLGENEIKNILNLFLKELRYRELKQPKKELIRPLLFYQIGDREYDLKEVGEAIDIALEVSPGSVISFYTSSLPLEGILAHRLHNLEWIGDTMRAIIDKKIRPSNGILYVTCDFPRPIHFLGNLARKMGALDEGMVGCQIGEKKVTSIFELAKAPNGIRNSIANFNSSEIFPFVLIS